jgi:hypothetical protein
MTDEEISKSGLLFDQIERQIIREFYEKSKTKSKSWIWWHKNSIVTHFESLKAKRNFYKAIKKSFEKSLLFKLMAKLDRFI